MAEKNQPKNKPLVDKGTTQRGEKFAKQGFRVYDASGKLTYEARDKD